MSAVAAMRRLTAIALLAVAGCGGMGDQGVGSFGESLDVRVSSVTPNPVVIPLGNTVGVFGSTSTVVDYEFIGTARNKDRSSCGLWRFVSGLPGVTADIVLLEASIQPSNPDCAAAEARSDPLTLHFDEAVLRSHPSGSYTARIELQRCYDDISVGGPKCTSSQFDFTIILDSASAAGPPPASQNLFAVAAANAIDLRWQATPATQSYLIERAADAGPFMPLATLTAFNTSYRDTGAATGTQYTYRLTATNASGASPAVIASARIVPLPLALTVTLAGSGSGTVSSDPAGIDCPGDCSETYPQNSSVRLNAAATGAAGFAAWSGDCTGTSPSVTVTMAAARNCNAVFLLPPAAAVGLTAYAGDGSVELRWTDSPGAATYELTRTPGNNGAASRVVNFAARADSYVDTSVASDTLYTYELVARNPAGASPAARAFVTTPVAANWTRIGAADIDAQVAFAQPALALSADGNTVAVAQVVSGTPEQTQVFTNDAFTPNSWTRLAGTPGAALTPAAAGTQPAVAIDSQGAAIVAWTQAGPSGNDIRVARYDSASAQWVLLGGALDTDPSNPTPLDATQPELVLDANDRPVVAWLHSAGVWVKRWDGSAWVGVAGGCCFGPNVTAVKLALDAAGTAHLLLRQGNGSAAQLFAYREGPSTWSAPGAALNAPLGASRDSLPFFDLVFDSDGSPLAVWTEAGSFPSGEQTYVVHASRWRNGAWQALPDVASATGYAITGLAVARSVQAPALTPTPPVVMLSRQPTFSGANQRNAYGDVHLLQNDTWTQRPSLLTFGPMLGLTLRVTRQATPIAAWLAETGALGSGELRLFVWRGL